MDNVIRPIFGTRGAPRLAPIAAMPDVRREAWRELELYGGTASHFVALIRDEAGPTGRTHRVVIGSPGNDTIRTIAVVASLPNGEREAKRIALAVLHALDIVQRATSVAT